MISPLAGCEVVFVLPHLGPGGAQKVACLVANQWASVGVRIGFVSTLDDKPDAHRLDPAIVRVWLTRWHQPTAAKAGSLTPALRLGVLISYLPWKGRDWVARWRRRRRICASWLGCAAWQALRHAINLGHWTAGNLFLFFASFKRCMMPPPGDRPIAFSARWKIGFSRFLAGRTTHRLHALFNRAPPPRVISFLTKTNIHTALALWDLPTHLVISERNDPDLQKLESFWQRLRLITYRRADCITSNSVGVLEKLGRFCPLRQLFLLPNPILLPRIDISGVERAPEFVTLARLVHQKGVDVLLRAMARIADQAPEWDLSLIGDGPLREELETLAAELGIADRVKFHGHVDRPLERLCRAGVFVLPSRFEGMPNSLLEAMAVGLPPIVTDASPGPLEIVEHEATGLIVPAEDVEALAAAMLRLARDGTARERLGAQARLIVEGHNWPALEAVWCELLRLPRPRAARSAMLGAP